MVAWLVRREGVGRATSYNRDMDRDPELDPWSEPELVVIIRICLL
jgi:hypothetical protein